MRSKARKVPLRSKLYKGHGSAYNEVVAESLKVPKDQFEAAIRALLNTPPTPMADIPRKREPKATAKPKAKKGG